MFYYLIIKMSFWIYIPKNEIEFLREWIKDNEIYSQRGKLMDVPQFVSNLVFSFIQENSEVPRPAINEIDLKNNGCD